MNKAIFPKLAIVLIALLNFFGSSAWALSYDGPGPERVAIIDQMQRIWVDDHESMGEWRDVTGNLHGLTTAPATISSLAVSPEYLWVTKQSGDLFRCTRPCSGSWRWIFGSSAKAVSGYGSLLFIVNAGGRLLWVDRGGSPTGQIGTVSGEVRSITGGSKQVHVLEWVGSGSRITTFERQIDGKFAAGNNSYIKLPAGRVVKISSAGDEFIGLVNDRLWLFDHVEQRFSQINGTRPHDFSVGSRWLWRIGANNQFSNGILTKTLLPCLSGACREITVPLPLGVVPDRVEAY